MLCVELSAIKAEIAKMEADDMTMEELIASNTGPANVVLCKGLTQVTHQMRIASLLFPCHLAFLKQGGGST